MSNVIDFYLQILHQYPIIFNTGSFPVPLLLTNSVHTITVLVFTQKVFNIETVITLDYFLQRFFWWMIIFTIGIWFMLFYSRSNQLIHHPWWFMIFKIIMLTRKSCINLVICMWNLHWYSITFSIWNISLMHYYISNIFYTNSICFCVYFLL